MKLDEKYVQPTMLCDHCHERTEHVINPRSMNSTGNLVIATYYCRKCGHSHQAVLGELAVVYGEFRQAS